MISAVVIVISFEKAMISNVVIIISHEKTMIPNVVIMISFWKNNDLPHHSPRRPSGILVYICIEKWIQTNQINQSPQNLKTKTT